MILALVLVLVLVLVMVAIAGVVPLVGPAVATTLFLNPTDILRLFPLETQSAHQRFTLRRLDGRLVARIADIEVLVRLCGWDPFRKQQPRIPGCRSCKKSPAGKQIRFRVRPVP